MRLPVRSQTQHEPGNYQRHPRGPPLLHRMRDTLCVRRRALHTLGHCDAVRQFVGQNRPGARAFGRQSQAGKLGELTIAQAIGTLRGLQPGDVGRDLAHPGPPAIGHGARALRRCSGGAVSHSPGGAPVVESAAPGPLPAPAAF